MRSRDAQVKKQLSLELFLALADLPHQTLLSSPVLVHTSLVKVEKLLSGVVAA